MCIAKIVGSKLLSQSIQSEHLNYYLDHYQSVKCISLWSHFGFNYRLNTICQISYMIKHNCEPVSYGSNQGMFVGMICPPN